MPRKLNVMPRRFFHYVCVLLLLVAQQGAIAHATWHAGGDARSHDTHVHGHENDAHEHASEDESPSLQGSLCALDLMFGQVLGGMHGACVAPAIAALPATIASNFVNPRLGSEAVPALARGPPIFL